MKLRFRQNSLRFRLNQNEVALLAAGRALEESILFPGNSHLVYRVSTVSGTSPLADFSSGVITVSIPEHSVTHWHGSAEIGLYYRFESLQVAIEKDLECRDLPSDEQDPHSYPREAPASCS